jgi:transcriptional regulator with XRE-family HTH domain
MSVSERFRKVRESLKLTQDEMGDSLGSTRAVIGDIERGKSFPNPKILSALHFKYNIDLNWLICGSGKMKHSQVLSVDEGSAGDTFNDKDKYIQALEANMELNREIKILKETLDWYKANLPEIEKKNAE